MSEERAVEIYRKIRDAKDLNEVREAYREAYSLPFSIMPPITHAVLERLLEEAINGQDS